MEVSKPMYENDATCRASQALDLASGRVASTVKRSRNRSPVLPDTSKKLFAFLSRAYKSLAPFLLKLPWDPKVLAGASSFMGAQY